MEELQRLKKKAEEREILLEERERVRNRASATKASEHTQPCADAVSRERGVVRQDDHDAKIIDIERRIKEKQQRKAEESTEGQTSVAAGQRRNPSRSPFNRHGG
jgi:hypothetical protein